MLIFISVCVSGVERGDVNMSNWQENPYVMCMLFVTYLLTLLLSTAYTTWGVSGRKRRLSAACQNACAGGMLYRDSVSLTLLVQVFQGRPLALRPLNLV